MHWRQTGKTLPKLNETLLLGLKGDKDNLPWKKKIIDSDVRYLFILGAALLADVSFHFGFRIYEWQCEKCYMYKSGN